jgi:DNA-directed RNA polymerase subunit RPC12/RpoP
LEGKSVIEGGADMSGSDSTEASYINTPTELYVNVLTGICLFGIGIGLLFCFWPLGVGLILAGLIVPFYYTMYVKTLQGPCPHCGHKILVAENKPGVTCAACKKRSVIRSKRFVRIE